MSLLTSAATRATAAAAAAAGGNMRMAAGTPAPPQTSSPIVVTASPFVGALHPNRNSHQNSGDHSLEQLGGRQPPHPGSHHNTGSTIVSGGISASSNSAAAPSSSFDPRLLDQHLGKMKAYCDERLAQLEAALADSRAEAAELRGQLMMMKTQQQQALATPSMALGARYASPDQRRLAGGTVNWEVINPTSSTTFSSSATADASDGGGFFAAILQELRNAEKEEARRF